MTEQEMNDFLQSIGGLKIGYYSDREPIMTAGFFECDEGWYQLIKDLITDLIELGWNKEICQVKEKFGGLRFYINEGSDEIHARISKAEDLSYETCEITGKPGILRQDIGWWTTLCDEEYQKILEKRKQ
jgi:hypothetical protein